MQIEIRPLSTLAEFAACAQLQIDVWGAFGAVPDHMLLIVQKSGGQVIGAFDHAAGGAPLVGFVFGIVGQTGEGRIKHASHMAAVLPGYRDARIGERLKWAQRERVLAQGIDLITWTFDPLISRNANLNIHKLGAVCNTYIENVYGPDPVPDDDLPSDRFQVDWHLESPGVSARALGEPISALDVTNAPLLNPDPTAVHGKLDQPLLQLQIPADIDTLRVQDFATAKAWRYRLRAAAQAAFAAGYRVIDYQRHAERGYYLLAQQR